MKRLALIAALCLSSCALIRFPLLAVCLVPHYCDAADAGEQLVDGGSDAP